MVQRSHGPSTLGWITSHLIILSFVTFFLSLGSSCKMLRWYSGPIGQHSSLAQLPILIIFCDYVGTIELEICLSGGPPSPSSFFFSEKSKDVHVSPGKWLLAHHNWNIWSLFSIVLPNTAEKVLSLPMIYQCPLESRSPQDGSFKETG